VTQALIVGAGSIGSRHAEVLSGLGHDIAFVSSRTDLDARAFPSLELALSSFHPRYVVIANETALHAGTVGELAASGFDGIVLVEKPLATPESLLATASFSSLGVAYNLRFHPLMSALAHELRERTVLTVEVYAGQHLTTWRPGRDARTQYSGSASRGGGVLRDLSHELDYLGVLLGRCGGVFARGGRLSNLTADSDDAWGIVAQYERAEVVSIQLNYLDTQTRRRLVINTGSATIEADFVSSTLRVDDTIENLETARNTSYVAMHQAMLHDNGAGVASAADAARTDALIATIEHSAATSSWIVP
jgi:predicted dehydrogenase